MNQSVHPRSSVKSMLLGMVLALFCAQCSPKGDGDPNSPVQNSPKSTPRQTCLELQAEVSGFEAAIHKCAPWTIDTAFEHVAISGRKEDDKRIFLKNASIILDELREYTDERDNLATCGIAERIVFVRAEKAQFSVQRQGPVLRLGVPNSRPLDDSELVQLALAYLEEYEQAIQRYWVLSIRHSIPKRCSFERVEIRHQFPDKEERAAALRELDASSYKYPREFHKTWMPTIVFVKGLNSQNGEKYSGLYSGCDLIRIDIDSSHSVESLFHHELAHMMDDKLSISNRWPRAKYLETWDYENGNNNPTEPARGFVSAYAMKDKVEDIAEVAELMMTDCERLVSMARNDNVIAQKAQIMAQQYAKMASKDRTLRPADRISQSEWGREKWISQCGVDLRYEGFFGE